MSKIDSDNYSLHYKHQELLLDYYRKINLLEGGLSAYKKMMYYDSLIIENTNRSKISELELEAQFLVYEDEMKEKEQAYQKYNIKKNISIIILCILIAALLILWRKYHLESKAEKRQIDEVNSIQKNEIQSLNKQLLHQLSIIKSLHENNRNSDDTKSNQNVEANEINSQVPIIENSEGLNVAIPNIEKLSVLRSHDMSTEESWKEFKLLFDEIYPNFNIELMSKIGDISKAQLRLLMLHKLQIGNKEIAAILNISPEGVKKANHRIYKKLEVDGMKGVQQFLEVL